MCFRALDTGNSVKVGLNLDRNCRSYVQKKSGKGGQRNRQMVSLTTIGQPSRGIIKLL